MNTILVFVAVLGFALCELPTTPLPLPGDKKASTDADFLIKTRSVFQPGEPEPKGIMEGKRPGRPELFGRRFDKLNETEKAELEKKREEIKKEVREKMLKLIEQLNSALDKQTAILDDKALSHKDKLKQLRKLKEENPKVYNVLKAIKQQFVPKKFGRDNDIRMMMKPRRRFGRQRELRPWQKGTGKSSENKRSGRKKLPELNKPMPAKLDVPVKA